MQYWSRAWGTLIAISFYSVFRFFETLVSPCLYVGSCRWDNSACWWFHHGCGRNDVCDRAMPTFQALGFFITRWMMTLLFSPFCLFAFHDYCLISIFDLLDFWLCVFVLFSMWFFRQLFLLSFLLSSLLLLLLTKIILFLTIFAFLYILCFLGSLVQAARNVCFIG